MQTPGRDLLRQTIREPASIVLFRASAALKNIRKKTKDRE